jgi:muramidase (phage lysozyme)
MRRLEDEFTLVDPRVAAFLDTISFTEGSGYNTLYGGGTFNDLSRHPGYAGAMYQGHAQSASGRYQIQIRTFTGLVAALGPLDFSPHSQDVMAVDLIRAQGALPALQSGDLARAVTILAPIWASFPHMVNGQWQGSVHGQPSVRFEAMRTHYNERLQYHSTLEQTMQRILIYVDSKHRITGH